LPAYVVVRGSDLRAEALAAVPRHRARASRFERHIHRAAAGAARPDPEANRHTIGTNHGAWHRQRDWCLAPAGRLVAGTGPGAL